MNELQIGDKVRHFSQHLEGKIINICPETKECKVEVTETMEKDYIYFYITPIDQWEKIEEIK